ncbi:MAG: arsenical pump-driving ATPase, partial [Candidatus Aenigmarchaeota archaeon]|nr:arsenical pump-driving ATPase [Candidatus Aenigmarchaeota archaeon]
MSLNNIPLFDLNKINITKYLFFTGKGGVGKTSAACAVAVALADKGKKVLLISTDPASNLQDVFGLELNSKGIVIPDVPSLTVTNLNPEEAAKEYRESVIAPYRGKLPETTISNMEEQLSGSCTVEIAAFDQFSKFITDDKTSNDFDNIIFDTAPTGHTLRMLQLPSAWNDFISHSTHGASCLGQLSGLEDKKEVYKNAVKNLSDTTKTILILVARPERTSFLELKRTSDELSKLNIMNQLMIVNGVIESHTDKLSKDIYTNQQDAIASMPNDLKRFETYFIPLRAYNVIGIDKVRAFLTSHQSVEVTENYDLPSVKTIQDLIDDVYTSNKKVILTMGKGGVGKTTVAVAIAKGLAEKGSKVLLTTTDPANHLIYEHVFSDNIEVSSIDEKKELERYSKEVLSKASETMNEDGIAYIEEDLRSPCTQEIAVFRAFAEIVEKSTEEIVVIDTAPTGHTLLLLDSTLSYHKEVQRTKGETPLSVQNLLPRLRDSSQTEVVIVTLPEATPVFEASRLKEDLARAGIPNKWWVINKSLFMSNTTNPFLNSMAKNEIKWIKKVTEISTNCAV